MESTLNGLRQHTISASLFTPVSLQQAIQQLGFVQADPIRAPARAQDLILRHRVRDYRTGDLEQQYLNLELEEDFLYAYGFMPRTTWQLLHPRPEKVISPLQQQVLALVTHYKRIHPRELETHLGTTRERNDWGGYSKATTRALQSLHFQGFLRISQRENGIRLYEPATRAPEQMEPHERLRKLVLLLSNLLGPLPERSLRTFVHHLGRTTPTLEGKRSIVSELIKTADLSCAVVDNTRYVWAASASNTNESNETIRFLTPFDPLVLDRQRFEHFWGWAYRFEAYTPPAKRQLGYYAMPMLWRDDIVGWVNVSNSGSNLVVEPGFKKDIPIDAAFEREYENEVERFRLFLQGR